MKKAIRIIAVIQLILAAAFVFYAGKIDPGVAKISKKLAETCGKTAEILSLHKNTYEKSNIIIGKNS